MIVGALLLVALVVAYAVLLVLFANYLKDVEP
jgi:hypothetical protein